MIRLAAIAAILLAATAATAREADRSTLLRSQGWTDRSAAGFETYLSEPRECLSDRTDAILAGRALFRSPVLFGGPAARVGLSCEACHAGGRINTAFLLPELTDRPAHADVTSEWASKVRGDGVFNPAPIPDLAGAGARSVFGSSKNPSLRAFIRSVMVDEFQGPPPPEDALDAVVAYVAALQPCAIRLAPVTLRAAADDTRAAVDTARTYDRRGSHATASLLLYAAQDSIARIVERLPAPGFAGERRSLALLAQELGVWRDAGVDETVATGWRVRFDAAIARLARRESRTYFNRRVLARDLITDTR